MKNVAGIIKRLLAVTVFLGCSAVVCCGIASNSNEKAVVCSMKNCSCSEKNVEDIRPSQLVLIRIMQLI